MKFDYVDGHPLADELDVDAGQHVVAGVNGDWPSWIGATRIRLDSPGCYAFQVDGTNFTEVIVFQAVHAFPESRKSRMTSPGPGATARR